MPDTLLLDDIGMALLDQLAEAQGDLQALDTIDMPRLDEPGWAFVMSHRMDVWRTRDQRRYDMALEFIGHVWFLSYYPETPPTRRLPWHLRLDEETMQHFDDLRTEADNTGPESRSLEMLKEIAEALVERYEREKGKYNA